MSTTEPPETVDVPAATAPQPVRRSLVEIGPAIKRGRRDHPVIFRLVLTLLAMGVAFVVTGFVTWPTDVNIAIAAAMSIVILGLSFLTGFSGQVSLGNGAFFGVGCYAFAIWANHHTNSSIVVDLLVATGAGALAGLVVGIPATRLRGPYLAGMTIAVAIAFGSLIDEFSSWTNGDQGLTSPTVVTAPGWLAHLINQPVASARATNMWLADIAIVVTGVAFFLMANLFRSRKGVAMRLTHENEVAAELVGVSLPRARVTAFVVSAALAGLGGGLTTLINTNVYGSTFGLSLSIQILTLLVIGGIGTLSGALIGGLLFSYSTIWIAQLVSGVGLDSQSNLGSAMPNIIFGALLIICVLVAPLGIAGTTGTVISRRLTRRQSVD